MLSSVDEINIIRRESVVNVRRSILVTWALLAAILFGLLVLSITIPKFGSQYISLNCQSVNPNSGIPLISAYYHLFRGFGSSTDCSNENGNFW